MKAFEKIIGITMGCFLLLSSCEKKTLPPSTIELGPSLFISGNLEGERFYYGGGEDSVMVIVQDTSFTTPDTLSVWNVSFLQSANPVVSVNIRAIQDPLKSPVENLRATITQGMYPYSVFPEKPEKDKPEVLLEFYGESRASTTVLLPQSGDSFFKITEIKEVNKQGLFYIQATVSFQCIALSGPAPFTEVKITNGKGVVVFGGLPL